jgi:hypothetical protein
VADEEEVNSPLKGICEDSARDGAKGEAMLIDLCSRKRRSHKSMPNARGK